MYEKYLAKINISNRAKRIPICFCIDTSNSMGVIVEGYDEAIDGKGTEYFADQSVYRQITLRPEHVMLIDKIHQGLKNFYDAILDDDIACDSCESAIITFNDVPTLYESFSSIEDKTVPDFTSVMGNDTNITPAIRMALDLLEEQKNLYKQNKISYYQPWLVLFTDGLPTDDVSNIKSELMQMQNDGKISVYTMALTDAPELLNSLRGYSKRSPISCSDPKEIQKFFTFLAKSVSVVAAGGNPKDYDNYF